ncbi:MAG: hypothetical protein LUD52_06730 [Opitutae bacterium]|nr:hypothetical protein [Opitutae bacterium]
MAFFYNKHVVASVALSRKTQLGTIAESAFLPAKINLPSDMGNRYASPA